ncbi:MAG: hypothetical protein K6G56_01560 [Clostridiales bacterium]|nr:hypothetical protein [Clostridiales bacterium]
MIASIIINAAIILINIVCSIRGYMLVKPPIKHFRYFTTLSNLLCAVSGCFVIALWAAKGALPLWTVILKYAGTCSVTVTMLTVLFFLGPVSHEWKLLLSREQLFLHAICPVMAIVSFLVFEKGPMPPWTIAIGVLPVILYGALYCKRVVFTEGDRKWEDFYGFNHNGKWAISCGAMVIAGALIAFALWAI